MNNEGQDSKNVYSFAGIDFYSKYISFALLELLSTLTFVLLPNHYCQYKRKLNSRKLPKFNLKKKTSFLTRFMIFGLTRPSLGLGSSDN